MGRTNPTYRDTLTAVESRWSAYRRALRRRDQPHFDAVFGHGRAHADAAGQLNHAEPLFPLLVSALVEQERRIAELEAALDPDAVQD
ncbi:hypothetical protein N0B31_14060 [Salinirubellus salinus]|jgi:hypothetical protein|uniref:DUF8156 domain-containing protein n=1 Tax=Salinirubellus salinus TaxID=1364945 RepID=A0A9E7R099_9EURY|nr:hypothetical protein [Salinirubellus salinus]UWM53262.1 hypothetical protein N0B31_14060 [Salinirubellus salinus]